MGLTETVQIHTLLTYLTQALGEMLTEMLHKDSIDGYLYGINEYENAYVYMTAQTHKDTKTRMI